MNGLAATSLPSRRERELSFRVSLVLDAAEEVFAEQSFASTPVAEIARRAEVSVGTLYNLFDSKEDIYRAVVSRSQEMFFRLLLERIDEARGPHEKVKAAVTQFFDHFSHYSRQFRLYVSATNGFQWELTSKLVGEAAESQALVARRLVDTCQAGINQGIFKRGINAELMAITVLGVPHSFLMLWLEGPGGDMKSMLPAAIAMVERITGADGQ